MQEDIAQLRHIQITKRKNTGVNKLNKSKEEIKRRTKAAKFE